MKRTACIVVTPGHPLEGRKGHVVKTDWTMPGRKMYARVRFTDELGTYHRDLNPYDVEWRPDVESAAC